VMAIGQWLGGGTGAIMGLLMAAGMNLFMYWGSSSMVLRSYNAKVVSAQDAPDLYAMVDRLRQRAGLPMPVVAIAPHDQPNAFATGRNPENSVVCVTEGLMRMMNREELEGVIAHELAHIKNRDMLLQTIAATMAGAIGNIAQFAMFFGGGDDEDSVNPVAAIAIMIIGPVIGMMIQFAISRQREFKADAVGAGQCAGSPGNGRPPYSHAGVTEFGVAGHCEPIGRLQHARREQVVQHAPAHRRACGRAAADRGAGLIG
jgi:heat shock protein HtpX